MATPPPSLFAFSAFTRGTGRSTLIAALALRLAQQRRVLVVDADLACPRQHRLLGLPGTELRHTLNDFFVGLIELNEALHLLPSPAPSSGQLLLLPSSEDTAQVLHVLREAYRPETLFGPLHALCRTQNIEVVLIDMPAGLSDTTLPIIALSDALWVVMRLDVRDYEGVAVTLDVTRRLEPRPLHLVVNQVQGHPLAEVERQVSQTYGCPALALPFVAPLTSSLESEQRLDQLIQRLLDPQGTV